MYILPSNIILSSCRKLIWKGSRNNDVIDKIRNINNIDKSIKNMVANENKAITKHGVKLPSGEIDGIINGRLLYIAISDTDAEKEWHHLHMQKLMSETRTLRECLLLTVNKNTGDVQQNILPFKIECVVDYLAISEEPQHLEKDKNDSCNICPLRGECYG